MPLMYQYIFTSLNMFVWYIIMLFHVGKHIHTNMIIVCAQSNNKIFCYHYMNTNNNLSIKIFRGYVRCEKNLNKVCIRIIYKN